VVQSEETTQLQAWKSGKGQRIDLAGWTGKYLWLNAEGRRISESRMRENRTYGLMRGRWQPTALLYQGWINRKAETDHK